MGGIIFSAVGSLDEYLESLACIQQAISYFQKNNPESHELHNLVI